MTHNQTIRSQSLTVFLVGMLVVSTIAFAIPALAVQDSPSSDAVQTLEDGEDLYLSLGAELDGMTLEEYIEAQASGAVDQSSSAEVIQYQDVDQVNLDVQGNAVSVSIDGGDATAVQEANQQNINDQTGEAEATNDVVVGQEVNFENVGTVYVLVGSGDDQRFDGWAVLNDDEVDISQSASATVSQHQEVEQLNYNQQSTALAIAENGSEATAIQQSEQRNENHQIGVANATNVYAAEHDLDKKEKKKLAASQDAEAFVEQSQEVDQENINEQDGAIAIAVGENSTATAIQLTDQTNVNTQYASADAENIIAQLDDMNMATATTDAVSDVDTADVESDKKDKKKDDGDEQQAEAEVVQYQSADQINVNLQSTALAVATNGSEATAVQMSVQENYNAQIGYADATNVYSEYEGVVYTDNTTLTVGGNDVADSPFTSFDYDGNDEQLTEVDQYSLATVEQVQFIEQVNVNEQYAAIAVAEDGGEASAIQVNLQTNENYQFATSEATDSNLNDDTESNSNDDAESNPNANSNSNSNDDTGSSPNANDNPETMESDSEPAALTC